jgi:uncharacterized Zn finger protein
MGRQDQFETCRTLDGGGKKQEYPLAFTWLKRAKQAYQLLGKTDEWKKYLGETREKYKRRPALQNQLARL